MAKLGVSREVLARMLRGHGEDELAARALSLSDDELARIGTLGAYYAFSEDAMVLGGSMGGTRAFAVEDLRIMIGQQVALDRVVPLALKRLQPGPVVEGDDCAGDLLASVLRVDGAFWEGFPDLDVSLRTLTMDLWERFKLEAGVRELIETFTREHSARRRAFRNGFS